MLAIQNPKTNSPYIKGEIPNPTILTCLPTTYGAVGQQVAGGNCATVG